MPQIPPGLTIVFVGPTAGAASTKRLYTSAYRWELDVTGETDDVSPDWISESAHQAMTDLLDRAFASMVALDWTTTQVRTVLEGDTVRLVTTVDVLR